MARNDIALTERSKLPDMIKLTHLTFNQQKRAELIGILQTIIYCVLIPVSYTHLDVYKRQFT